MDILHDKMRRLEDELRALGGVLVAFSSGVDSTFLLRVAHDVLGDRAVAATVCARPFPAHERDEARRFCEAEGIEHLLVEFDALSVEGFRQNPPDRCYHCKRALFGELCALAARRGIPYVAEGSNADDVGDYRPGLRAVAELGVQSPLRDAGMTKEDIRILSRELGLPTWEKPSFACLATRFVYGEAITAEKLSMVDRAEQRLLDLGFRQVRVRVHGELARIEVPPDEFPKLIGVASELERELRGIGFRYVSADLGGYRTGSMNRDLQI